MCMKKNHVVEVSLLVILILAFPFGLHNKTNKFEDGMSEVPNRLNIIEPTEDLVSLEKNMVRKSYRNGEFRIMQSLGYQDNLKVLSPLEIRKEQLRLEAKLNLHAQEWFDNFAMKIGEVNDRLAITALNQPPAGGFIINGNDDLINQSAKYGWPGDGSASNPYVISDYGFSSVVDDPCNFSSIDIYNTTLFVKIANNTFDKIYCSNTPGNNWDGGFGIRLKSVRNVIISSNSFTDISNDGILMQNVSNIIIERNIFTNVTRSAIYGGYIGFPLLGQNVNHLLIRGNSFNNTGVYHPNADEVLGDIYIDTDMANEARNITISNNSIRNGRADYNLFIGALFEGIVEDNFFYNTSSNDGGSLYGAANIYIGKEGFVTVRNNIIRSSVNKTGIAVLGLDVIVEGNEISFNQGLQDRLIGTFDALDVGIDAVAANDLLVRNNTVISNTYLAALYLFTGYNDGSISASGNWTITNNTFSYNDATGIWIEGTAYNDEIATVYISENKVDTNKKHGLLAGSVNDLNVRSNTFSYNDMNGILLYSVMYSSFEFNDEIGNGLSGINTTNLQYEFMHPYAFFPADDPSLNNDFIWEDIIENGKDGISIGNGDGYTIKNANIIKNKRHGIYSLTGIGSSIITNTIRNNTRDGILNWAVGVNISENVISENGGTGVTLTSSANETSIMFNYILEQGEDGISVEYGPNGTEIIGNTVESNEGNGVRVDGRKTMITNNTIIQNIKNGIDAIGNSTIITDNIISGNGKSGLRFSGDINGSLVMTNSIINNTGAGVLIDKGGFDFLKIVSNTITENMESGINSTDIENPAISLGRLVIQDNLIAQNRKDGVHVNKLDGILEISENKIKDNGFLNFLVDSGSGIEITETYPFINISRNEITSNLDTGISIEGNVTILDLTITQNNISDSFDGIFVGNVDYGTFSMKKNEIWDTWYGLKINGFFGDIDIRDNTVRDSSIYGIYLNRVNDTELSYNGIYNSGRFGLVLGENAQNTNVTLNDFSFNLRKFKNPTASQSIDNGTNNLFNKNFWNDWVTPDNNGDNYVDYPYQINGTAANQDPLPRALRPTVLPHMLLKPFLSHPVGGETISGVVNVTWDAAIDTANHPIAYNLYYSVDDGKTWIAIAESISDVFFLWNTQTLSDGIYMVKLEAEDSFGYKADDRSDTFSISNGNGSVSHELTPITLLSPNGGETLSGIFTVMWTAVNDSLGHQVFYSLFYSSDGGLTWNILISNLTEVSSYQWDTTSLPDGDYLMKINATDYTGLTIEDFSDAFFTIKNNLPSTETSTSTTSQITDTSPSIPTSSQVPGSFISIFSFQFVLITMIVSTWAIGKKKK